MEERSLLNVLQLIKTDAPIELHEAIKNKLIDILNENSLIQLDDGSVHTIELLESELVETLK